VKAIVRITTRMLAITVAATAIFATCPRFAAAQTDARVTVGDHALDVVQGDHGGPPIVFETGLADSLDVWLPMWRELHDEWFRRSHNGIHIVTDRSGHGIQDDEPALVEEAIHFVLDRARARP
jgi:hypothetical protein